MGVEKLGHRKIVMQAIRVLFDKEGVDDDMVVDPMASASSRVAMQNNGASVVPLGESVHQNSENAQEKTGTV